MGSVRVSVAMAVYNGEKYISEQIDSILQRMGADDELVISYDISTDCTKRIIDDYAMCDSRVRVVENTVPGVRSNFNNAINSCRGRYIFLSDQDDVWIGDKINIMIDSLEAVNADLVVHDGYMTDERLNPFPKTIFERFGVYNNPLLNMVKCNYWGCCMAFRSELWKKIGPFPTESNVCHDHWLGILAGFYGKITRVDECLLLHRMHGSNVSSKERRAILVVLRDRLRLILLIAKHLLYRK